MLPTLSDFRSPRILIVGCGNSRVGEQLYVEGYHDVTNIDISSVVVAQMKHKYRDLEGMRCAWRGNPAAAPATPLCPHKPVVCAHSCFLTVLCSDVRSMDVFRDDAFDLILDKAVMDTLFSGIGGARDVFKMNLVRQTATCQFSVPLT